LLSRRNLSLIFMTLLSTGTAIAAPPPAPVVLVQYVVSDRSAGHVQEVLTSPLQRTLSTLHRVVNMQSVTTSAFKGVTVDLEIQFEGGATAQDLAAVFNQIAQSEVNRDMEATSVSFHLRPPRIDNDTGLPLR
jgi:multidrug efflux pump subunit AcrB